MYQWHPDSSIFHFTLYDIPHKAHLVLCVFTILKQQNHGNLRNNSGLYLCGKTSLHSFFYKSPLTRLKPLNVMSYRSLQQQELVNPPHECCEMAIW